MKKALLVIFLVAVCVLSASCLKIVGDPPQSGVSNETEAGKQPEQTSAQPADSVLPTLESAQPTPAETGNTAPDDAVGAALAYMDPSIDIFIVVPDAAWKYTKELYEGEVYFYPGDEDPTASPNGFAISSQKKQDGGIEAVWESWEPSLESQIDGFAWKREDDITIGSYTGCRYHFTATNFTGDYIFWETDALLYICSLSSDEDSYDTNYAVLAGALGSFKTLDEAGVK